MKKITIAIDGYSSTGKSTLAKELAKKLGYIYVDTGAMYRTVALYAMQNNLVREKSIEKNELIRLLDQIDIHFEYNNMLGFAEVFLNNTNVENKIRSLEVSQLVSKVAEISEVRAKLVEQQQKMGENKGIVMDGRDIGTVVFPNAELKIFMNASTETKAKRRFLELKEKGMEVSYDDVLQNVQERDFIDTNRTDSPLKKATDAIEIDNSFLSREEQFEKVYNLALQVINA